MNSYRVKDNIYFDILDQFTNELLTYTKTDVYVDGSPMDASKCDGYIYRQLTKDTDGQQLPSPVYVKLNYKDFNLKYFGVSGDGVSDDTNKFITALTVAMRIGERRIYIPAGTYLMNKMTPTGTQDQNGNWIVLPLPTVVKNIKFVGENADSTIIRMMDGLTGNFILLPNGSSDLAFENLTFESNDANNNAYVVKLPVLAKNISFNKVVTKKICLLNTTNQDYNTVNTEYQGLIAGGTLERDALATIINKYLIQNISITNCVGQGAARSANVGQNAWALISYCYNVLVANNIIDGYFHGVQYWGGDSNGNGAAANVRLARNITLNNNIVTNINQGGLWGSMGDGVVITGNNVEYCGDVGIDVEGTFGATMSSNHVRQCFNSAIAMFYLNKNINVVGNTLQTPINGQALFMIKNSSQSTADKDVNFTGNVCMFTGTAGKAIVGVDGTETITIKDNTMTDVVISLPAQGKRFVTVSNNDMLFTQDINASSGISITNVTQGGVVKVSGNRIYSKVSQTGIAIELQTGDDNNFNRFLVQDNFTVGWATDCQVKTDTTNLGIRQFYSIRNNFFGSKKVERVDNDSLRSFVWLENNKGTDFLNFPNAIPTSGKWEAGQVIYSNTPAQSRASAWKCTQAGTIDTPYTQWTPSTAYVEGQYVKNNGFIYKCVVGGTSGTTGPTGNPSTQVDGTVTWDFYDYSAVFTPFDFLGEFTGSGSPEGVINSPLGGRYLDTSTGDFYIRGFSPDVNTTKGWVPFNNVPPKLGVVVNTNYTLLNTDQNIMVNAVDADVTITLPDPSSITVWNNFTKRGKLYFIKNITSIALSTHKVFITTPAGKIATIDADPANQVTTYELKPGGSLILQTTGGNWYSYSATNLSQFVNDLPQSIPVSNYSVGIEPTGAINGVNVTFTLPNAPIAGKEMIFLNGLLQDNPSDYTISGSVITFVTAPPSTSKIKATYIY